MDWTTRFILVLLMVCTVGEHPSAQTNTSLNRARAGKIFNIFQFPQDQMPRIDGHVEDWSIVPAHYRYGMEELVDTEDGMGDSLPSSDLEVEVCLGWVAGLNRIYFLYKAYDDYWDFGRFNPQGYLNDIFELVVDGDLSGGPFIFNPAYDRQDLPWNGKNEAYLENHMRFSGVHAQNYHIFTPPVRGAWTLVWGSQPWIAEFPRAHQAYTYDFEPGESGQLVLEGWITPYDYAPSDGPEQAVESKLEENKIIGISWSILDFDGGEREGHINLSHDTRMVKDADYLCAFRLSPLEQSYDDRPRAEWTFRIIDRERNLVAFEDLSKGEITNWWWDFGDGQTSSEQHPLHTFQQKGVHKVISLTVSGPAGKSIRTRYWEVMLH